MKKLFMGLLLLILILNFALAGGLSLNNGLSNRQKMDAFMQFGGQEKSQDTVSYSFEKSPALAFMMSAVVPGAGQFYADKKWWTAGFLGIEALGWGLWYNRKTYGEDMEDKYKSWADGESGDKWNLYEWVDDYNSNLHGSSHNIKAFIESDDAPISGTLFDLFDKDNKFVFDNKFDIKYSEAEKKWVIQDVLDSDLKTLLNDKNIDIGDISIEPVRSRDFYENIGKYDQFVAGWDDYEEILESFNEDSTWKKGYRMDYMGIRDDSNQALKMATKSLTVVMFNHLFSALHAQFAAKHYSSDANKPNEMSWNLSLTPGYRRGQLVSGINLSFAF